MNSSDTDAIYEANPIYGVCLILEGLIIIGGNGLVVVVYVKSRDLRVPAMLCLTFFTVDMLLLGVYLIIYRGPISFVDQVSCDHIIHKLANTMFLLTGSHSLHSLVICVIDRYVAVCKPLRYANYVTNKTVVHAQGITIILLTIMGTVLLTTSPGVKYNFSFRECQIETSFTTFVVFISCYPIPALSTVLTCYTCIFREVRKKRRIHPEFSPSNHVMSRIKVPATVTALIIGTGLAYIWVAFLSSFKQTVLDSDKTINFAEIGMVIFYGNGIISTVVFAVTLQPFKESVVKVFCHSLHRKRLQRTFLTSIATRSSDSY